MGLPERLAELVSFDTQNPEGDEGPIVHKLAQDLAALGATAVDEVEVGDHAYVYARFGAAPTLLLNAHVDTVPANAGYSAPPHLLVRRGSRLHGLGAADTKGAIAAILEALAAMGPARAKLNVGVLFSGDEERTGTCIRAFLDGPHARGLERAIVCEPTGCRVGVRHRGIAAATATVEGPGGHSSRVDGLVNPIAVLARAAVALDDWRASQSALGPNGFEGLCVNLAALDGGLAFNVVPTRATLKLSLRPAPGVDVAPLLAEAERIARAAIAPVELSWHVETANPSFATRDLAAFAPLMGDVTSAPIDLAFWTEAARLSERGVDAVVYGPGRIEEAHAADEFVEIAELEAAQALFTRALQATST
ncbi:MAG TPA: M20/M25/M40 family metallo-hydrolase [Polyangia bacterium]|nr:M20/M25/M40 family metallo-hydrolase [Polyangia bacterium]